MRPSPLAALPDWHWQVPYVGTHVPGGTPSNDVRRGANCQLWAYEVLRYFGYVVTDLRSDDLWHDTAVTRHVDRPQPLDLVLYNGTHDPYGAHVGLWTGDAVAHLCSEVGHPIVWDQSEFDARPRYSVRIGFKRPIIRPATGPSDGPASSAANLER